MKKTTVLVLVTSMVLVAGLFAAGCLQAGGNDAAPQSGGQALGPNQDPAAGNAGAGSQNISSGAGADSRHQVRGSGMFQNATQIDAAATKLGVTGDALRSALNQTPGGRPNLTAAAEQLGVTSQQLSDALGIPAGGFRGHSPGNTSAYPRPRGTETQG
jgi:hypothetical protein